MSFLMHENWKGRGFMAENEGLYLQLTNFLKNNPLNPHFTLCKK